MNIVLCLFTATAFQPFYFYYNKQMLASSLTQNTFDEIINDIETGDEQVTDVQVVFYDEYLGLYIVDTFDKKNGWANNSSVSINFNNNKISALLANDEVTRLFDNVPLKAKAHSYWQ